MRQTELHRETSKARLAEAATLAWKRGFPTFAALFIILVAISSHRSAQAQATSSLPLEERVLIASKIYRIVSTYFPHLSQENFDEQYADYVAQIVKTADRREFDLTSMAFVASLHDAHTWFYDNWLDEQYGRPVGFIAYPIDGQWTIVRSRIDNVSLGDVIVSIGGTPVQAFYAANRKYISASSERDAGVSFFDTPAIFPSRFAVGLGDGRQVVIDRLHDQKKPEVAKTEGRWVIENKVAYIKIPTFHGIDSQAQALDYVRQFHAASAIIIDVRGNPGLGESGVLQKALMTKPYQTWRKSSSMKGGVLLRDYDAAYPERSDISTTDALVHPSDPVYSGRLLLLIDRGCTCACEDFVMPFKFAKRAVLVGETTAGSFSSTDFTAFPNGMLLNVASIRHTFPDGSQFEGVGISPDIEVHSSAQDLKQARDIALATALQTANSP